VPTNDPQVRRSAVTDMAHFGEKVTRLRELREQFGRTGPFDLAIAPPFRPKEATKAAAEQFLGEVEQLKAHGVNWLWTTLPARSLEEYCDFVAWFGEEIVAVCRKG
jgi:hypothetical protein